MDDVGGLGVVLGVLATLAGVFVTAGLEGRRRQRQAMRQVQRLLLSLDTAVARVQQLERREREAKRERDAKPERGSRYMAAWEARWAAERDADKLVHEIELLIPDLPRRVRGLVEKAAEVLTERYEVDISPGQAVSTTRSAVHRALKEALGSSRLRWWFFRRWGRAKTPPVMREYLAVLAAVYVQREDIYQAQQEERAQGAAQRAAERKAAAAVEGESAGHDEAH